MLRNLLIKKEEKGRKSELAFPFRFGRPQKSRREKLFSSSPQTFPSKNLSSPRLAAAKGNDSVCNGKAKTIFNVIAFIIICPSNLVSLLLRYNFLLLN